MYIKTALDFFFRMSENLFAKCENIRIFFNFPTKTTIWLKNVKFLNLFNDASHFCFKQTDLVGKLKKPMNLTVLLRISWNIFP